MITLLSGTNRPGSATRNVVRHLEEVYRTLGVPCQVLDLTELPPETYLPSTYGTRPAALAPFVDLVMKSDGLVVVTPEYNGSFPGALKYFIDVLPFPAALKDRPACFIGLAAGEWGGLRAVEQLQMVFGYRHAHLFPGRVFIRAVHKVLDASGKLTDADLVTRLAEQAGGFSRYVQSLARPHTDAAERGK